MPTLADIKTRVRNALEDPLAHRFSDSLLETAILQALARVDERVPRVLSASILVSESGRDQPLASLEGCLYLVSLAFEADGKTGRELEPEIEFTYTLAEGAPALHFSGTEVPQAGETLLVRYAAQNTLSGLNGALTTTLPSAAETTLVNGAAAFACLLRAASLSAVSGARPLEYKQLVETSRTLLEFFERSLVEIKVLQEFGYPIGFKLDQWDQNQGRI